MCYFGFFLRGIKQPKAFCECGIKSESEKSIFLISTFCFSHASHVDPSCEGFMKTLWKRYRNNRDIITYAES